MESPHRTVVADRGATVMGITNRVRMRPTTGCAARMTLVGAGIRIRVSPQDRIEPRGEVYGRWSGVREEPFRRAVAPTDPLLPPVCQDDGTLDISAVHHLRSSGPARVVGTAAFAIGE